MRSSTIKNNFTSGELSPLMYGRNELEPYQKGLAVCENMRVLRHGGVTRRDGTRFISEVKDSTKQVRLVPFIFSDNQSYIIEMGAGYMRFLDESGHVIGGTNQVTNGEFDANITGWTAVVTGSSSVYWNSATKSMGMTAALGSAKSRQTLTGLTTGVSHTFKFDMAFIGTPAASVTVRLGSTLGGTEYVGATMVAGVNSFPVTFTAATAYLEFEVSHAVSVRTIAIDNVSIKDITAIAEVVTPFLEDELFDVMFAQSNDIMWFTHRNHFPSTLKRLSASSFSFSDAVINWGPFAPVNTSATIMTLTAGAYTEGSTGALTASVAYFDSTDVGANVILYDDSDLSVFAVVKISAFTSTTVVSVLFLEDIPVGLQASSNKTWALQAISARYGYPAAVSFHDQRLFYAGTTSFPQSIYGSTVATFESFTVGIEDDDHVNFLLATTKQSDINWLAVKHDLIIGTISNEWSMRGGGLEDPLTPSNVVTRPYRSEGSIRVQPEELNDLVTFVQRSGHKVIGLAYAEDVRSVSTTDLTLLSEHLTSTSIIRQLSYQSERESILWIVTDIGQLLGMTYDATQNILAWHKHTTGASGKFESVATIPVSNADQTWVVVNRTVNGSIVRNIEFIREKDWRIDDDPYYVDSGISYAGTSASIITGLDHLEGEEVVAYAAGENLGEYVVASGQITLSKAVIQAHVGLDYSSTFTELPEGSNAPDGSAHTRQKRKPKVDLRLYKTQGIRVNGDIRELPRDASVVKPELFSGIIESSNLGWDKDAANTVSSVGPNPLTVLAIRSTFLAGQE